MVESEGESVEMDGECSVVGGGYDEEDGGGIAIGKRINT